MRMHICWWTLLTQPRHPTNVHWNFRIFNVITSVLCICMHFVLLLLISVVFFILCSWNTCTNYSAKSIDIFGWFRSLVIEDQSIDIFTWHAWCICDCGRPSLCVCVCVLYACVILLLPEFSFDFQLAQNSLSNSIGTH